MEDDALANSVSCVHPKNGFKQDEVFCALTVRLKYALETAERLELITELKI